MRAHSVTASSESSLSPLLDERELTAVAINNTTQTELPPTFTTKQKVKLIFLKGMFTLLIPGAKGSGIWGAGGAAFGYVFCKALDLPDPAAQNTAIFCAKIGAAVGGVTNALRAPFNAYKHGCFSDVSWTKYFWRVMAE